MLLMLDTHALAWISEGNPRMPMRVREAVAAGTAQLRVSAITAYEYADLHHRGRLPDAATLETLQADLLFEIVDFPGTLWALAASLPPIHRDPIDRMMIAHTIALGATLISADKTMRSYPVETLW